MNTHGDGVGDCRAGAGASGWDRLGDDWSSVHQYHISSANLVLGPLEVDARSYSPPETTTATIESKVE